MVEVALTISFNAFLYLDMGPSRWSSGVLSLIPLVPNLYFFLPESQNIKGFLLHRQIFSVQRISPSRGQILSNRSSDA